MGGMIAQEVALTAPELVEHLVLGCTTHGGADSVPAPREFHQLFPAMAAARGDKAKILAGMRSLAEYNVTKEWAGARSLASA